jgi:hypothetical protein
LARDLAAAKRYVETLLDYSTRYALTQWRAYGHCCQGALLIKRSDIVAGSRLLGAAFDELGELRSPVLRLIAFLMMEALGRSGHVAEALSVVEEAIAHSKRTEDRWLTAELLRIRRQQTWVWKSN